MDNVIIRKTEMLTPMAKTAFDLPEAAFSWDPQTKTDNGEPLFKVQTDMRERPVASILLEIG